LERRGALSRLSCWTRLFRRTLFGLFKTILSKWVNASLKFKSVLTFGLGVASWLLETFRFTSFSTAINLFVLFLILYDVVTQVGERVLLFPKPDHIGFKFLLTIWAISAMFVIFHLVNLMSTSFAIFTYLKHLFNMLFGLASWVGVSVWINRYLWRHSTILPWRGPAPRLLDLLWRGSAEEQGPLHELKLFLRMKDHLSIRAIFFIPGLLVSAFALGTAAIPSAIALYLPETFALVYPISLLLLRARKPRLSDAFRAPGIEESMLQMLAVTQYGMKGFTSLIVIMMGFGFSTVLLFELLFNTLPLSMKVLLLQASRAPILKRPFQGFSWLFFLATGIIVIAFATIYPFWYWIQIARRLPHFLQSLKKRRPENTSIPLPSGLMLPALLPYLIIMTRKLRDWLAGSLTVYLVVLDCVLLACLGCIVYILLRFRFKPPEPLRSDNWRIPLALAVQIAGSLVPASFLPDPKTRSLDLRGIGAFCILFFYLEDVERFRKRRLPSHRYSRCGYDFLLWLLLFVGVWYDFGLHAALIYGIPLGIFILFMEIMGYRSELRKRQLHKDS